MTRQIILIILTLFAHVTASHHLRAEQPGENEIRQILQDRVIRGDTTGIVVGIITDQGTQVFGYGQTSREAGQEVNGDTLFEIGSITKLFTATVLSDMDVRGELSINDPIEKYLPPSINVPVQGRRKITFLDLATHSAGLPRDPPNRPTITDEQMYELLSQSEMKEPLGTSYLYSNFGFGLLGHILARKSNCDYETLIRRRICDPLQMNSTRITLTPDLLTRTATGYSSLGKPSRISLSPDMVGCGAIYSTVNDQLKFLAANMGLTSTRLDKTFRNAQLPRRKTLSSNTRVGLAWRTFAIQGRRILWHGGKTNGFHSYLGFVQGTRRGVVVLANTPFSINDIALHLLDASFPLTPKREQIELDPSVLDDYVGQYQLRPNFIITITKAGERLFSQATKQAKYEIYPEAEDKFFYKAFDAQITFLTNDDAKVTHLILHQNGRDSQAEKIK